MGVVLVGETVLGPLTIVFAVLESDDVAVDCVDSVGETVVLHYEYEISMSRRFCSAWP